MSDGVDASSSLANKFDAHIGPQLATFTRWGSSVVTLFPDFGCPFKMLELKAEEACEVIGLRSVLERNCRSVYMLHG